MVAKKHQKIPPWKKNSGYGPAFNPSSVLILEHFKMLNECIFGETNIYFTILDFQAIYFPLFLLQIFSDFIHIWMEFYSDLFGNSFLLTTVHLNKVVKSLENYVVTDRIHIQRERERE